MKRVKSSFIGTLVIITILMSCESNKKKENVTANQITTTDPLPSWNEGQTKTSIVTYVNDVSNASSENFIPIADRIATFDNDGYLLAE